MAALFDEPERLLSKAPLEIAEVPDGEPASQLCALISAIQSSESDP
jgi:hypothetical protein